MDMLPDEKVKEIVKSESSNAFKFGGSRVFSSIMQVRLPVVIGGLQAHITTVIESESPLFLSK